MLKKVIFLLQINGSEISAEVPPTIMEGRTMVPVRAIFEAVGANIDFDAETKDNNS